ncbi:hypothetical protein [Pseudomonas costantinii]|uniref:Uncharacterized protein n=1 Tax=Pseudomonas costantinii TaxID=168469 RepID=A0A1S2UDJ0_9PSED|nr:hypothetical protein [Pseudomonas costantinii]OIN44487.1 hypothetical protein BFL40_29805 [Pseudomonas costantinii]SED25822.1 hypothetical protein SAMN04515675_0453 [Pseudomonas costantinii]
MSVTIGTASLSKQAAAYVIKNPHETKNAFTVKSTDEAADILKISGSKAIAELKDSLKGYDLKSISTRELATIGSKLYESGLIDETVASRFTSGSMAFDKNGQQTDKDTKFNAIAMFNQMLGDTTELGHSEPANLSQQGFKMAISSLVAANHVANALAYFVNSAQSDLSVKERA